MLAGCLALLGAMAAAPELRERDLSALRRSVFRIPRKQLTEYAREFSSRLPVLEIVMDAERLPRPDAESAPALVRVFDRAGTNRLTDLPRALLPFAEVRSRGKSSLRPHFRQKSIRLKILDEKQKPSRFDLCGFPAEDQFALVANAMDRSMARDWIALKLAEPLFAWVPRAKHVEVFVRKPEGWLDAGAYWGVYLAVESATGGRRRIDVGELEMAENPQGLEGGGWVVRRDRTMPGRPGFALEGEEYVVVAPGSRSMTEEALEYIRKDFSRFRAKIRENPPAGDVGEWVDVESFVNMMALQEFTKNRDAFIFSAYYHRAAGGKMVAGPPWDFNLAMGNSEGFTGVEGLIVPGRNLAGDLLRRPEIFRRFRERWKELRAEGGAFSEERVLALAEEAVAEAGPAAERHFGRYPELLSPTKRFVLNVNYGVDSFEENVRIVRDYLVKRGRWLDETLAAMEGPEDLFSEEMERAWAESEALGIGWWREEESAPLGGGMP